MIPYVHPGVGRFVPLGIEGLAYACGDIHGRHDLMLEFLAWVGEDRGREAATVVFLGDYVDRGPASRRVVETLMRGPTRPGEIWVPLKGNHDRLFAAAWRDLETREAECWYLNGGPATMASYGIAAPDDIARLVPEEHVRFLEGLQLAADDGERLFVHAGVMPGLGIAFQSEEDMTWIREPFLDEPHGLGRLVVHGHTISRQGPDERPWRLGIDTGAYATGRLTGARFDPGHPVPRLWQSGVGPLPPRDAPVRAPRP